MRLRRLWPAALLLLTPVLVACGDDADDPDADPTSSSATTEATKASSAPPSASASTQPPVEVSSQPPAADDNLPAPCAVIHYDEVGAIMGGLQLSSGSTDVEDEEEGGTRYLAPECSFEAEDLVEVSVRIYGAGDYLQGSFGCLQPSDSDGVVEPASDVTGATEGWWKVSSPPNFAGFLRACTATAIVEVELDYEDGVDYEGDPKAQATEIAEFVLSKI